MTQRNFYCNMCKQNKNIEYKRRIILEEIATDNFSFGVVCSHCYYKLKHILESLSLTPEMKQQSLNVWGVKIE